MSSTMPIRKLPRAHWYDYRLPGTYFVTICCKGREHFFGNIYEGEMKYTAQGIIGKEQMEIMLEKRKMLDMHNYVIMPNHIHFLMVVSDEDKDNFKNQSISSIIGSYKAAVSKECHKQDLSFGRQTSFYEHIIRNEASYEQIYHYIESNIDNREKDKFYQHI